MAANDADVTTSQAAAVSHVARGQSQVPEPAWCWDTQGPTSGCLDHAQ